MFYTNVRRFGNTILHRYADGHGGRYIEPEDFSPTLFVTDSSGNSEWKTLKGISVKPQKFENIKEARNFHEQFKDIRPDVVHGITDYDLLFIHERYTGEIDFNFNLIRRFVLDIECDVPNDAGFPDPYETKFPINAITVYDSLKSKYYTFSTVAETYEPKIPNCVYVGCRNELQLITAFMNWWEKNYPDIVTGWNSEGFDIPYIVNRFTKLCGEEFTKRLSPWNRINARDGTNGFGQDCVVYELLGIDSIDYIDMYKKFTLKNRESYKLGFIASIELNETKVEFDGSLYDLARDNPEKFLDYNLQDVALILRLDQKLQLLFTVATLAYLMKVNYSDTLGTVRTWTSKVAYELFEKKMVIDAYHRQNIDTTFEAAYVKDPIKGRYGPVATLDAKSMYPHMIMLSNISPETKIEYKDCPEELKSLYRVRLIEPIEDGSWSGDKNLQKHNITIAGNGQMFRKDREGILPEIMAKMFAQRSAKKKEMLRLKSEKEKNYTTLSKNELEALEFKIKALDVLQNSLKVALNSCFGTTGNKHFPLFDLALAEAITFNGQAGIRFVSRRISEFITKLLGLKEFVDFVIYIDTDSLAVNLTPIMDKFGLDKTNIDLIQKIADEKISEVADAATKEYCEMLNGMWPALEFKREKICSAAIYTQKKRYILKVWDNEGVRYHEPEISVTGLETNRSSTPKFVRDALLESYELILDADEETMQNFVADFYDVFKKQDLLTIAFPRGVNDLEKYQDKVTVYKKGCPINARAALMYNSLLRKHGLENKYMKIFSGNKIKFIHIVPQNPTRENVIGFIDCLPPEFGLDTYIDYDLMFDKTFKEPLQNVLNAVGWSTEKKSSLNSFF